MVMSRSRGQESSKGRSYIGLGGMKTFIWEDEGGPRKKTVFEMALREGQRESSQNVDS